MQIYVIISDDILIESNLWSFIHQIIMISVFHSLIIKHLHNFVNFDSLSTVVVWLRIVLAAFSVNNLILLTVSVLFRE